jgi:hypothetical protein
MSNDDTETESDLPELSLIGLAVTGRGWCVVEVTTQGHAVIDTEILFGPDTKAAAGQQLLKQAQRIADDARRRSKGMRN